MKSEDFQSSQTSALVESRADLMSQEIEQVIPFKVS
jgi:hypothetical protein